LLILLVQNDHICIYRIKQDNSNNYAHDSHSSSNSCCPFLFDDDETNGVGGCGSVVVVVIVDDDKLSEVIVSSDLVNGSTSGFDETISVSSKSRSQLSPDTRIIIQFLSLFSF